MTSALAKGDAVAAAASVAPAKETEKRASSYRVDADSNKVSSDSGEVDLGLPRNLLSLYDLGDTIGKVKKGAAVQSVHARPPPVPVRV